MTYGIGFSEFEIEGKSVEDIFYYFY